MHASKGPREMYQYFLTAGGKERRFRENIVNIGPAVAPSKRTLGKNGAYVFTTLSLSTANIRIFNDCHMICAVKKCTEMHRGVHTHSLQSQLMETLLGNFTEQSAASESIDKTSDQGNKCRESLDCIKAVRSRPPDWNSDL